MSVVDTAIQRIQAIALQVPVASTDATIALKAAPNYPVEDATALPIAITYLDSGSAGEVTKSNVVFRPTVNVDFHFSRLSLKNAYKLMHQVAENFSLRLAGDPTLNAGVTTIVFPVEFSQEPTQWDAVTTQMLRFVVHLKILETPVTST